ncbi:ABC transporter ATP-binding protein [Eudoraea sp.]|uniref:ABC transporter ATP-binding protein n=1 Tax=Eudoraea sp. TaxID=1979955 RepID=UPI003C77C869
MNFEVYRGELVGIIGVNGIGKSTLLRSLAKVQPKLSGTIEINKKDLEAYRNEDFAKIISVVLTEPIATKNLSVLELVALGRQPHTNWLGSLGKEDKEMLNYSLRLLELDRLKYKKCFELSDGQMQRALIARALCQDTKIIMLDEPTTHLDLYHKVEILKLLKRIAVDTGKIVLFTSHEIDLAIQLCHKMLILKKKSSIFGDPCSLIEQKSFEDLFPKDSIAFNANTGTFKIVK